MSSDVRLPIPPVTRFYEVKDVVAFNSEKYVFATGYPQFTNAQSIPSMLAKLSVQKKVSAPTIRFEHHTDNRIIKRISRIYTGSYTYGE